MTNLPVTGTFNVTCIYGKKGNLWSSGYHKGIDLTCSNLNIYSSCDGVVKTVGWDSNGWGQYVRVEESTTKKIHIFCHLVRGSVKVSVGQTVSRTTILGTMGTTGNSTGVHLHFQIEDAKRNVYDPTEWLGIPNVKGTYNSNDYHIPTAKPEVKEEPKGDVPKVEIKEPVKDDVPTKKFKDEANISVWAKADVNKVVKEGIVLGDDKGNFRPNDPTTRAEMAAIICRGWKNNPVLKKTVATASKPFNDVSSAAWYYNDVETCRKAGIIRGDENGKCNPSQAITRQDAIVMIMRVKYTDAQLAAMDVNALIAKCGFKPTDFDLTANYAKPAMAVALGHIVKGDGNGAINPTKMITRQEIAVVVARALNL